MMNCYIVAHVESVSPHVAYRNLKVHERNKKPPENNGCTLRQTHNSTLIPERK
eukprot:JP438307.1.p4 GENE.JP438307.1~~JP438307.1.p4  ORF type:complete len:53 (+),score=0.78 JP438307.1:285-443(+)